MSLSNCPKTVIKRQSYEQPEKKTSCTEEKRKTDFSSETMQSRKQCSNILIILKENNCQPRILYPEKNIFHKYNQMKFENPPSVLFDSSLSYNSLFFRLCQFAYDNNYLGISLSTFTHQQCTT